MISFKRLAAALLLMVCAVPAWAQLQFAIGEPAEGAVKSGVGQVSGWAVSDREIVSIEAFIDGASLGMVPYGGSRMDVAAAFPQYPDAEHSGWAMKWNYSLHEPGEHLLTLLITEDDGTQTSRDVLFYTTRFNSEFIRDPGAVRTKGALVTSPADGRIVIEGAEVEGEVVDIELQWDKPSQQFLIDKVEYLDQEPQQKSPPVANAGPDQTVETERTVSVAGSGSDPDGWIASVAWTQVSGPDVSLSDPAALTVEFTAPEQPADIRLRLTVTDDHGMSDSDDVVVTVVPQQSEPEPNLAPTAHAGSAFTVTAGDYVEVQGSGSDSDGQVVGWSWQQVSGPAVSLQNAASATVGFTAPDGAAQVRLRLTVTDDDGATDTDDVIITVEADSEPSNTTGETLYSMLDDINDARSVEQNCGGTVFAPVPPLEWSASLADIAMQHSMDMAEQGYFSHTSIDNTSFANRVWPYWDGGTIGENIAASSANRSDSYVVDMWLGSPGHCELLMSPNFTHAGVGKAYDPDNGYTYKYFWTLDFGG